MPAKSGKQYRFMQAVRSGASFVKDGPSKEVAEKFIRETPKSKRSQYSRKGNRKSSR